MSAAVGHALAVVTQLARAGALLVVVHTPPAAPSVETVGSLPIVVAPVGSVTDIELDILPRVESGPVVGATSAGAVPLSFAVVESSVIRPSSPHAARIEAMVG